MNDITIPEPGFWGSGDIRILFFLVGGLALLALVAWFAWYSEKFSKELRYLNMEIRRTRGAERRHYLRRRRKLWLSLIPFVKY